ncbi:MAG TPA: hypothetical protein VFU02_02975 [Polyangiaceae bacterium]|nr:hypothetical protein [Polyangiaceae bacterium]
MMNSRGAWERRGACIGWVLAAALGPMTGCGEPWSDYHWTASSSAFGLPKSGTLKRRGQHGLLFHTTEEAKPWVVVDMLENRTVRRISVENRLDCCQDRGLPLIAELGTESGAYVEVGRRTTPFDTWEIGMLPTRGRYVRLRADRNTFLHLRAIAIQ